MKLYELSKTKFENIEIVIIDDLMNREYLIDGLTLKDAKYYYGEASVKKIWDLYYIQTTQIFIK